MRTRRAAVRLFTLLPCLTSALDAQVLPLGSEFQVNTYTTSFQGGRGGHDVAAGADGNFMVVWTGCCREGVGSVAFGRRYDNAGHALGPVFELSTAGFEEVTIAATGSGTYVIVFDSFDRILGQRYADDGSTLGTEFPVTTSRPAATAKPAVAATSNGGFVAVWSDSDGSLYGLFGQRFASTGARLGGEFQINTYTTNSQSGARVTADDDGNFIVVWESGGQDGDRTGVFARRYAEDGIPIGTEFQVNDYVTSYQGNPAIAVVGNQDFIVVWNSTAQHAPSGVFGRRYASSGDPLGVEFEVDADTTGVKLGVDVARTADGGFVIVWGSPDADDAGMFGQRYASDGALLGAKFQVNTYTTGGQGTPGLASSPNGDFVVVWLSYRQDGDSTGVFGQGFTLLAPVCIGDCDGNGAVTVDELVTGVNIALGNSEATSCVALDANDNGGITVDELVRAVNVAVTACPT